MRIVGRTFKAAEAPPFIDVDEETLEAAAEFAEAGEFTPPALDGMNVAQLKAFAEEKGIALGGAKVKADIIAAIVAAMSADDSETE